SWWLLWQFSQPNPDGCRPLHTHLPGVWERVATTAALVSDKCCRRHRIPRPPAPTPDHETRWTFSKCRGWGACLTPGGVQTVFPWLRQIVLPTRPAYSTD